jgi:segregation and condensation protein A
MTDRYRVRLPVFEGPLDLLLSLIEREELDITRVSLAQVTDQYLAYLDAIEEVHPEILADFLVVAAKLILIKSQALLPRPPAAAAESDVDAGDDLVEQLRLYKQFKAAAAQLRERQDDGLRTYIRLAPPPKVEPQLDMTGVGLSDLMAAVREALQIAAPPLSVDQVVSQRKVTIRGQMDMIRGRLQSQRQLLFGEMLARSADRVEIAITFLAILELIKRYEIAVRQEDLFGPIVIEPYTPALDKER